MNRRHVRDLLVAPVILGALRAFAACGKGSDDPGGAPPGTGNVVVAKNVTSLDAHGADDVVVTPTKLWFPKATHADIAGKKPGDVLVAEAGTTAGTRNKYGFLRKVVSVTDDGKGNYAVATKTATFLDLLDEGEFQATIAIPVSKSSALTTSGLHTTSDPISLLDFSGKELFHKTGSVDLATGKSLGYDASLVLSKGTLDFTPTFDVGVKIKPALSFDIKKLISEAHAIATGKLEADAEVTASFKLTSTATGDDVAALIAKKVFDSPSATLIDKDIGLPSIHLGFLSVPAHAHFSTKVVCDLKWGGETTVVVGAKASVSVSAGARYDGSTITPVFDHTQSLDKVGPTFTITDDVALKCSLIPQFELNLWDVAAGEVTAEAYASASAKATCNSTKLTGDVSGEAYAGAKAKAHAKLDVFGLYTWEKECTLFDVQTPKATFSGSIPLGKGSTCADTPKPADTPAADTPPPSCFGDPGSVPADAPGPPVDDGSGTAPDGGPPPDDGGVSDAAPDDGGGADADGGDADGGDATVNCDHDTCTSGGPLSSGCTKDGQGGACITAVCVNDSYCCEFAWTASCIAHVQNGDFGCAKKTCP
ncbi:MAG: hypothetical protein NVS3B10_12600 [Polyangiales bacterium]